MQNEQQHASIARETYHVIPTRQADTFPEEQGYYNGDGVGLKLRGTYHRYSIFGWDQSGAGRVVYQGPIETGPHAWAQGQATILSDSYIPDRIQNYIEVDEGDLLRIRDDVYRVHVLRGRQHIELVLTGSYTFQPKEEGK